MLSPTESVGRCALLFLCGFPILYFPCHCGVSLRLVEGSDFFLTLPVYIYLCVCTHGFFWGGRGVFSTVHKLVFAFECIIV